MLKRSLVLAMLVLFLFVWACRADESREAGFDYYAAGRPQSLPFHNASIGENKLRIMIARTPVEKASGLMFFRELAPNQGMLFCYDQPQIMTFWMKNTVLYLDILFLDEDFRIVDIIESMVPGVGVRDEDLPRYRSRYPAQYALELPAGAVASMSISPGDRLKIPLPLVFGR